MKLFSSIKPTEDDLKEPQFFISLHEGREYYPGDIIRGTLWMDSRDGSGFHGNTVYIDFYGEKYTKSRSGEEKYEVIYQSSFKIFETKDHNIFDDPDDPSYFIKKDQIFIFPFFFSLPESLPYSYCYDDEVSYITKYYLVAYTGWEENKEKGRKRYERSTEYIMKSRLGRFYLAPREVLEIAIREKMPEMPLQSISQEHKFLKVMDTFFCFNLRTSEIKIKAILEKDIFEPKETLNLTLSVETSYIIENERLSIKIRLLEWIEYDDGQVFKKCNTIEELEEPIKAQKNSSICKEIRIPKLKSSASVSQEKSIWPSLESEEFKCYHSLEFELRDKEIQADQASANFFSIPIEIRWPIPQKDDEYLSRTLPPGFVEENGNIKTPIYLQSKKVTLSY